MALLPSDSTDELSWPRLARAAHGWLIRVLHGSVRRAETRVLGTARVPGETRLSGLARKFAHVNGVRTRSLLRGKQVQGQHRRGRLRVVLCESELDAQADRCYSREAVVRGCTGLGCYVSSKAEVLSRWVARRNASAPSGAAARPRRGVMKQ
jgi:hypothetical protein